MGVASVGGWVCHGMSPGFGFLVVWWKRGVGFGFGGMGWGGLYFFLFLLLLLFLLRCFVVLGLR